MQVELVVPPTKKPRSKLFPVLVFLLTACYGILTLVVIEQGTVIQSQRNLITQLMADNHEVAGLKGQAAAQQAIEKKQKAAAAAKSKKGAASADPAVKQQASKQQVSRKHIQKQPMQADDKMDRRRFPAQI